MAATPKGKHGGKRPGAGPPRGRVLPAKTIERIRDSINAKLAIDTLHELCREGGQHDSVRATAALGLLRFRIPTLNATDITSDGESLVIERVMFKAPTEKAK